VLLLSAEAIILFEITGTNFSRYWLFSLLGVITGLLFLLVIILLLKEKKRINDKKPKPDYRNEAEEELTKSERRYQTLTEISPVGIFHTDSTGYTTYVNPRWCRISGMPAEKALGNGWLNAVHKEDRESLFKGWEKATEGQQISLSEYRFVRPDGSIAWVLGQAIPEKNTNDEIIGYVGTITDITGRKSAEEAINRNEKKLELIYNTTQDIIFLISIKDNQYSFDSVNHSFLEATGLKKDQVTGRLVEEIIPEPSFSLAMKNYQAAINNKQSIQWEETSVYPSGIKTGIVSVTPVFDNDGKCNMLVGSVHDITELKKIENEILKEKQLSDSIINSLPGVFYLYNSDGKFLRWNKNFEQVSKYEAEEIKQMHPLDFFDTDQKKLLDQKIKNTFLVGEDSVQADFLLKTKEKIAYYFTGKVIDYEGSSCLMGVGIDFSERVKAQEKVKETTEQLRLLTAHLQSIREEERKRIGREIHDELGQQLTAIKMDIAWIDKKIPEDATPLKSKLKNVITLLDSGNQSIRRILSELRPGILDNHGLLDALGWLSRQVTSTTGIPVQLKAADIRTDLPEPITTCIFRVYQEALTNIIRYAGATKVIASLTVNDAFINLSIEDDGKGFDPGTVQINKSFGILGMKERVLSLGGSFELFSSPGEGARIFISLPLNK
jgi:PAS domain S-box-containing protein